MTVFDATEAHINIHSVMNCPLNYQRAQFTHGIHLDQQWSKVGSKVGSRDLEEAPDSVRGGLSERRDSFIYYLRSFKFRKLSNEFYNQSSQN